MYAPPLRISRRYLLLWARYCLRRCPAARYVIIFGKCAAGNRTQRQVDEQCGPCGLNPYAHLKIYKDVGPEETDEEVRLHPSDAHHPDCDKLRYVTIDPEEWDGFPQARIYVRTNDDQFEGKGMVVTVECLGDLERSELEREMEDAMQDPQCFP